MMFDYCYLNLTPKELRKKVSDSSHAGSFASLTHGYIVPSLIIQPVWNSNTKS